jgi:hypothetical protein
MVVLACGALGACGSSTVGTGPTEDAGKVTSVNVKLDAAPDLGPDVVPKDAPPGADDAVVGDFRPDAKVDTADAGVCKHEFSNPACWSTYDRSGSDFGLSAAVFDGTSVYFLNGAWSSMKGYTLRYDTTKSFSEQAAWSSFSNYQKASTISTGAFDGRYLYLISSAAADNGTAASTYDDLFGRVDTQAGQVTASSWSSMDLTTANGTPDLTVPGYVGAAFDGRYLYFAPYAVGDQASGKAMRFDTQASFTAATSWSWFDVTAVNPNAKGFQGALFDGRYVYLIPNSSTVNPFTGDYIRSGLVVRYDSKADFASASSWTTFDTATLTPASAGFSGATFDGRYIYLAPHGEDFRTPVPVRYDTKAEFTDPASWKSFTLSSLSFAGSHTNIYFFGASFDGRYVYYVPGGDDRLVRHDTQGDFSSGASWQEFSMSRVGGGDRFSGAAFDGRYLYVVPLDDGAIMRFDAVSPPVLPPGHGASFY